MSINTTAPKSAKSCSGEPSSTQATTQCNSTTSSSVTPNGTSAPKGAKSRNVWSTRQLVTMALLCTISVVLSFIEFPFLAVSFLKYDASMIPILLGAYAFGPGAGAVIGIVSWFIHALYDGNFYGAIMNMIVVCCYVLPASALFRHSRTTKSLVLGLVIGTVAALLGAIAGDIIFVPIYMNTTLDVVVSMIVPVFIPFNLMKAIINSIVGALCAKSILPLIEAKGSR
jgi:riboflavin transporter